MFLDSVNISFLVIKLACLGKIQSLSYCILIIFFNILFYSEMYGSPFLQQNNKKANCVFLNYFIFYLTIQTPLNSEKQNAEKKLRIAGFNSVFFHNSTFTSGRIFFYWVEFTSCNSVFFIVIYVMGLKKLVAIFYFTIHFFLQLQVCVSQMRFSSENSELLTIYILECLAILRLYLARKKRSELWIKHP